MNILITEEQLKTLISSTTEVLNEGSHPTKELRRFLAWAMRHMDCYISQSTDGVKVYPPENIQGQFYVAHMTDKAVQPLMRHMSKWFGCTKYDVERAFRADRPI